MGNPAEVIQIGEIESSGKNQAIQEWIKLGYLSFEKCELANANRAFQAAFELAQGQQDTALVIEALVGLLRYAAETNDHLATQKWSRELDTVLDEDPAQWPAMVWFIKGTLSAYQAEYRQAQARFLRFLQKSREQHEPGSEERQRGEARALSSLANISYHQGRLKRARFLSLMVLRRFAHARIRGVRGVNQLLLSGIYQSQEKLPLALQWLKRAHMSFLEEHNWYHHLYVLCRYATVARMQKDFTQAEFYLNLVDRAAADPEFAVLRRLLNQEKEQLRRASIDLRLIPEQGLIYTREKGEFFIHKQHILMDILTLLARNTHRSVSKQEIIRKVWRQNYQPRLHDNKLYYNMNRLRRLLEPDPKKPRYILNSKRGYHLSPQVEIEILSPSSPGGHFT